MPPNGSISALNIECLDSQTTQLIKPVSFTSTGHSPLLIYR